MVAIKRGLFFFLVKVIIIGFLLIKPSHIARGEKVYEGVLQNRQQNISKETDAKADAPVRHTVQKDRAYKVVMCNISAYTAHSDETGRGDGLTASGVYARAGRTIAMDDVPFGTRVEIEGHIYIVEDRFGGGYTNRIDIYMDTKEQAFRWGRRYLEVKIYE